MVGSAFRKKNQEKAEQKRKKEEEKVRHVYVLN